MKEPEAFSEIDPETYLSEGTGKHLPTAERTALSRPGRLSDYGLSLLSGLLLTLSFPKFSLDMLAWVALVPLLAAIRNKSPLDAFWCGFLAGLLYFFGTMYWVGPTMARYGNIPWPMAIIFLTLLMGYLALYVGVFTWAVSIIRRFLGLGIMPIAPLLWVSLEYLRTFLLTGLPWVLLGYSQYLRLPLVQIADIAGVYGISFAIVLVNGALCEILAPEGVGFVRRNRILKASCCLFITIAALYGYGSWRMQKVQALSEGKPGLKAGIVQANIDQALKWDPSYQRETVDIYKGLTLGLSGFSADLILWPESAMPFYFQSKKEYRQEVLDIARLTGKEILFGSPAFELDEGGTRFYNRAYLVSPRGVVLGYYDKVHLVPFGEYVPMNRYLPFIRRMAHSAGDFSPGRGMKLLTTGEGRRFGVLICYESIFPRLSRTLVIQGADFLVNLTNDAWFGRSSAPYQHLSMLTLRAVENRVYIARAANTGISAVIDNTGRIISRTRLFEREVLIDKLRMLRINSIYKKIGDLFSLVCIALSVAMFLIAAARSRAYRKDGRYACRTPGDVQ